MRIAYGNQRQQADNRQTYPDKIQCTPRGIDSHGQRAGELQSHGDTEGDAA
ncbi:hypothetical protein D3C76_1875940 [compost metagenome]